MKFLTWQSPEQLFVAQELINKVKSKWCGIKGKQNSMKQIITVILLFVAIIANAQNDTLHIATDKRDGVVYSRYYVINDSQFMIVHYKAEKNDTIYEESIRVTSKSVWIRHRSSLV